MLSQVSKLQKNAECDFINIKFKITQAQEYISSGSKAHIWRAKGN